MGSETCISKKGIVEILESRNKVQRLIHEKAAQIRDENISNKVYFRGLIEFSNICDNDCLYCGIRKSNKKRKKYNMPKQEIMDAIAFCNEVGYGSIVLQSGERTDIGFKHFVSQIVDETKSRFPELRITLCVGEQDRETYKRWFDAGAERYLLRIETSNKELYSKLHPENMSFENRVNCLRHLKDIGYQVGTGVMVASPYQTIEDIADDLLFFKQIDADMIGMGPYIPHEDTPLNDKYDKMHQLNLGINAIAALRMLMPDINIASTTVLQALDDNGREFGLLAGANVIMPIVTPLKYRNSYVLYDGKPCVNETAEQCKECISSRIKNIGMVPAFNEQGDSKHYWRRVNGRAG
jgi:biotin synthase